MLRSSSELLRAGSTGSFSAVMTAALTPDVLGHSEVLNPLHSRTPGARGLVSKTEEEGRKRKAWTGQGKCQEVVSVGNSQASGLWKLT